MHHDRQVQRQLNARNSELGIRKAQDHNHGDSGERAGIPYLGHFVFTDLVHDSLHIHSDMGRNESGNGVYSLRYGQLGNTKVRSNNCRLNGSLLLHALLHHLNQGAPQIFPAKRVGKSRIASNPDTQYVT